MEGLVSFGYIFRAQTSGGDLIDFLYNPDMGGNLKVVVNGQETLIEFPANELKLRRNKWIPVTFNLKGDSLIVSCADLTKSHHTTQANWQELKYLVFGVNDFKGLQTVDAAPFAIRDLEVALGDQALHRWRASERSGSILQDEIDTRNLRVKNPQWVAARNGRWRQLTEIQGETSMVVAHDSTSQRIFWVQPTSTIAYDVANNVSQSYDLAARTNVSYGLYNNFQNELTVFDIEPRGIVAYATNEQMAIEHQNISDDEPIQNLWMTAAGVNPLDSSLFLLGGYGFFTAKNTLHTYETETRQWGRIQLHGDTLEPRYHHAISPGPTKGQFYVFGGMGNQSGRQELGLNHFYDLSLIDLRDSTVRKLWNSVPSGSDFVPVNQMIFDPVQRLLYVLCYSSFGENRLALIRMSTSEPGFQIVGDSIDFSQQGFDRAHAGLFMNGGTNELLAYTMMSEEEKARLNVYSIAYPPILLAEEERARFDDQWLWYLVFLLLLVLLAVVYFKLKLRRAGYRGNVVTYVEPTGQNYKLALWGGFRVVDGTGMDTSNLFSPKIKELFLALLLHSFDSPRGMRTASIYELIWPGYDRSQAKNAMGVAISRLRTALSNVDGVEVLHEDGRWALAFTSQDEVDHQTVLNCIAVLSEHFDQTALGDLLAVISRGPFAPQVKVEWLEDIKVRVNGEVIDCLIRSSIHIEEARVKVQLADAILKLDDLHEGAVKIKITALIELGNHGLANATYTDFAGRFETLYQEPFSKDFQEMASTPG